MPTITTEHHEKAASLRAIRDREFNAAVEKLKASAGLQTAGLLPRDPPAWFVGALRWCHAWKSPERLVRIVERWRDRRFEGDDALYAALEAWRKQERHLHDWEDNVRAKGVRLRDQHYREEALKLVRTYTTVVVGDEDYRVLAVKVAKGPAHQISANRFNAAPGTLRTEIAACARKHGAEVVVVEMENVTKTCHICERLCVWDQKRELHHTCEHCGAYWDQDVNAAINMLRRASGSVAPEPPAPLADPENKRGHTEVEAGSVFQGRPEAAE